MSKDILLNGEHDLAIVDFDLAFTTPEELTGQKIKQTLLLVLGEWFLNNNIGLPYFTEIFGKIGSDISLSRIEAIYIRAIQSIPEVTEITYFNISVEKETRTLKVDFEVRDINSNLISVSL